MSGKVALSFHDIEFAIKEKQGLKHILRGVSGSVRSGEMQCIMGPSGCGKTSLIHILAKRIRSRGKFEISGRTLVQGRELTPSQFQRVSGLVTQEDVFNAALTVRETLAFGARLRLPAAQRKGRVEEVIASLQLERCASTHVGEDGNPYLKGISGGEKRRLAIALEILDPGISLLVLDEPTSGLDAAAALNVAQLLRSLAERGLAVVASLHQPRTAIMAQFQQLTLLSQGRQIFAGPAGSYVPYLTETLKVDLPANDSPYDVLLDALAFGPEQAGVVRIGALPEAPAGGISEGLADLFARSELAKARCEAAGGASEAAEAEPRGRGRRPWPEQFWALLLRTAIIKIRDPAAAMTQLFSAVFLGLIFGALYWDVYDKQRDFALLDAQMGVYISLVMVAFLPFDAILTFPKERKIFLRERGAGLYGSSALFLARILADVPMHVLASAIMALIIYPMARLNMGLHEWLLLSVGTMLVGAAVLQACGSLCRSFDEANVLAILVMTLAMLLSGSFVRVVPGWLGWIREISYLGLAGDLASYLEFRDSKLGDIQDLALHQGLKVTTSEGAWTSVGVLVAVFLVARLITYLGIKFLHTGRSFRENLWE